jgi:hypothetical protein
MLAIVRGKCIPYVGGRHSAEVDALASAHPETLLFTEGFRDETFIQYPQPSTLPFFVYTAPGDIRQPVW